jgi:chemotaxis protein methyltransferase CheR
MEPAPAPAPADPQLERIEIELLLEALWRRYGVDFRSYARASLARRIREVVRREQVPSLAALQDRVLRDADAADRLVDALCVNVTSMFRDPTFFTAFREQVIPLLRQLPVVRVWHAGCATGEEVWSVAILLHEAGLYGRTRIYATDLNARAIERAREGVYPLALVPEFTASYLRSGGEGALSDYYLARYDSVIVRAFLKRNLVFSQHDLATGEPFNDFHLVLCRNVLIYFDPALQERVHGLLHRSLRPGGVLALGRADHVPRAFRDRYVALDAREHLWRVAPRAYREPR